MDRSLWAVLAGTFTLRFSTGLTGALLGFYFGRLAPPNGNFDAVKVGIMAATFYLAEMVLAPPFGLLSDRIGHHRVMQFGPAFGALAVVLTAAATSLEAATLLFLVVIAATRLLEGASTAASVPSILGYIALITAGDEALRGRAAARFEAATLGGLGVGFIVAPTLFKLTADAQGRPVIAFLLNAVVYGLSYLIYRFGVADPRGESELLRAEHPGWRRYADLIRSAHVMLLAPTWIAINAAIGLWFSQSIYQFSRRDPAFPHQFLHRGFDETQITIAAIVIAAVFGAGLIYWGNRFKAMRRTTIILYGVLGGAALVGAGIAVNHSGELPFFVPLSFAAAMAVGLFVLAGATPAALGLLADVSEAFPADRGAIMGLYSVFLAIGQITGSLIGGVAAKAGGIDGLFVGTLVLLLFALVPLARLRRTEHFVAGPGSAATLD
ncbi:MAG: MFS transporter [Candidatus Limnocylindrales bacterium]